MIIDEKKPRFPTKNNKNEITFNHQNNGNILAQCSDENCLKCENQAQICTECKLGFYIDSQSLCQPCSTIEGCITCNADKISNPICSKCNSSYYLDEENNICQNCHESCLSCTNGTEYDCIECSEDYIMKETENGQICTKCKIENCTTCNDNFTECIECDKDSVLVSPTLCQFCANGTYLNNSECVPCDKSCQTCDGGTNYDCITCAEGYTMKTDDNGTQFCSEKCIVPHCQNCIPDQNVCNQFENNYYLENNQCKKCNIACETCTGPSNGDCLTCNKEEGYTFSKSKKYCTNCIEKLGVCISCESSVDICDLCEDGYQAVNGECKLCPFNCKTCTNNAKLCTQCKDGYEAHRNEKGEIIACTNCDDKNCLSCYATQYCSLCVDGYYLSDFKCKKCDKACKKCFDSNHFACIECADGYEERFSINRKYCSNCPSNCESCTEDLQTCIACEGGYYLNNNTKCEKCDDSCLGCEGSTHFDCIACNTNYTFAVDSDGRKYCTKCSRTLPNCIKCNDWNTQCTECERHYFVNNQKKCQACDISCDECTGATNKDCNSCSQGYYLIDGTCLKCTDVNCKICKVENPSICTQCSDGYYVENNKCKQCAEDCAICEYDTSTKKIICKKCKPEYIEIGGNDGIVKCYECNVLNCANCSDDKATCNICKDGYYKVNDNLCNNCHQSCKTCENGNADTNCLECADGYRKEINSKGEEYCTNCNEYSNCEYCPSNPAVCMKCKDGYFLSSISGLCSRCHKSCETCTNAGPIKCLKCNEYYHPVLMSNGSTICTMCDATVQNCLECDNDPKICSRCLDSHFYDPNLESCQPCDVSCKQCTGPSNLECTECADGYQKVDVENGVFVCRACNDPNCQTCSDPTICTTCFDGFYLQKNQCTACHSTCKKCIGSEANQCTECTDGFNLQPEGVCNECSAQHCQMCSVEDICMKCFDGYVLNTDANCSEITDNISSLSSSSSSNQNNNNDNGNSDEPKSKTPIIIGVVVAVVVVVIVIVVVVIVLRSRSPRRFNRSSESELNNEVEDVGFTTTTTKPNTQPERTTKDPFKYDYEEN
ncbi:hypothetical protein TRFO_37341 [Tritrichomonas foetus]|uniref:EGF-like domain-containing protein n=1 Tax=Tritrichomonas foetus TaxID=1144522 RepID=A0A1J4JFR6_9EUKA|nr:hypothetical protein TRFO_37341 [Tritrichomonas foetus]|eukprot:OHS96483.1 hypothetical protein TRFO_37341 [Tritrichomonas foetus]